MVSENSKNQLTTFCKCGFSFDFDNDGYIEEIEYCGNVIFTAGDTTAYFMDVPAMMQIDILEFYENWNNEIDS